MSPEARSGFAGWRWLLVVLLASSACKEAPQPGAEPELTLTPRPAVESSGPPTTIRLVVQLQNDGTFRMVAAEPRHGSPTPEPSIADNRQALLDGHVRLVAYTARDDTGNIVATGRFLVPMTAVSEFQDPADETRLRHSEEKLTNPTVRVSLPYQASMATIAFEALAPEAGVEPGEWKRTAMGEVTVSLPPPQDRPQPR